MFANIALGEVTEHPGTCLSPSSNLICSPLVFRKPELWRFSFQYSPKHPSSSLQERAPLWDIFLSRQNYKASNLGTTGEPCVHRDEPINRAQQANRCSNRPRRNSSNAALQSASCHAGLPTAPRMTSNQSISNLQSQTGMRHCSRHLVRLFIYLFFKIVFGLGLK